MTAQDLVKKPISHFVVPVCRIYEHSFTDADGVSQTEPALGLVGTAFFIGARGFAITAAHVLDEINRDGGDKVILIEIDGKWYDFEILDSERHPTEDVAILKVKGASWHSIMKVSSKDEYSSCEYDLWGYPESVALELKGTVPQDVSGLDLIKPELIYQRGYIRRRISRELAAGVYVGSKFYEVSEVAGSRCSGSPLLRREPHFQAGISVPWRVIGVYVGEQTSSAIHSAGYAVRSEAIAHWVPALLGNKLCDEPASAL